jgi:thymidylate kinase
MIYKILKDTYPNIIVLYIAEPTNDKDMLKSKSRTLIKNKIKYDDSISEDTRNELFLIEREILYSKIKELYSNNFDYVIISDRSFISNVCIQSAIGIDTFDNLLNKNIQLLKDYNIPTEIVFYMNRKKSILDLERSNDDVLKDSLLNHRVKIKSNYDSLIQMINKSEIDELKNTQVFEISVNDQSTITSYDVLSKINI